MKNADFEFVTFSFLTWRQRMIKDRQKTHPAQALSQTENL